KRAINNERASVDGRATGIGAGAGQRETAGALLGHGHLPSTLNRTAVRGARAGIDRQVGTAATIVSHHAPGANNSRERRIVAVHVQGAPVTRDGSTIFTQRVTKSVAHNQRTTVNDGAAIPGIRVIVGQCERSTSHNQRGSLRAVVDGILDRAVISTGA